jgi:hypothetical protein
VERTLLSAAFDLGLILFLLLLFTSKYAGPIPRPIEQKKEIAGSSWLTAIKSENRNPRSDYAALRPPVVSVLPGSDFASFVKERF